MVEALLPTDHKTSALSHVDCTWYTMILMP